jgi:hypothetical protein
VVAFGEDMTAGLGCDVLKWKGCMLPEIPWLERDVFRYDGKGNGHCLRLAGVAVLNCQPRWVAALYYIITITKRESNY